MQCERCLAVTSNKLTKTCPRKGCNGKLVKQPKGHGFSVMRGFRNRNKGA